MAICPSNMMANGKVFPNYAGRNDVDDLLAKELEEAGIKVNKMPWESNGEIKTKVIGTLGPWSFKRAWYYWIAEGDGIPPSYAWELYSTHGKDARIKGDCGCVDPNYYNAGFAIDLYHVDNANGLKALADIINKVMKEAQNKSK